MSVREEGHLGGYIEGGDPATWYPELWEWLVRELNVQTVVDVGCGEGQAIDFFAGMGCITVGVDGVAQPHPRIEQHDFTRGPLEVQPVKADLIWSCEFVEHVPAEHAHHFLETFRIGDLVLMTHAFPGQPGYHHVNCQVPSYWIGMLAAVGLVYDEALTMATRRLAALNENPWNHYVRSGLAFTKGAL